MPHGDFRILVWSKLLALEANQAATRARQNRNLAILGGLTAPVAIMVITRFAEWALDSGVLSVTNTIVP